MNYKILFISIVTILGFSSCGSGETPQNNENSSNSESKSHSVELNKTTVNNEAIAFPKSANQSSVPTDEIATN